jgi:Ca2+/Na+ antiporter
LIEGKKWPEYVTSGLQGFSVSIFGISILGMTMKGSLVQISIYSGILVYLLSCIPFVIFSEKYRKEKKRDYDSSFTDEKSKERDKKLNKILGIRI